MPRRKPAKEIHRSNVPVRHLTGPGIIELEADEYAVVFKKWDGMDREMAGLKKRFVKESSE